MSITSLQEDTLRRLSNCDDEEYIAIDVLDEVKNFLAELNHTFSWGRKASICGTLQGKAVIRLEPACIIEWGSTSITVHLLSNDKLVTFDKPRLAINEYILNEILEAAANYTLECTYQDTIYHILFPLKPMSGLWPKGLSYIALHEIQKYCGANSCTRLHFIPLTLDDREKEIILEDETDCIYHDNGIFTIVRKPNQRGEEKIEFKPLHYILRLQFRSFTVNERIYTLQRAIGKGSYGIVYAAQCEVKGEVDIAVKIIKINDSKTSQLVEREIAALKVLNHPHIVKFLGYKFMDQDSVVYLAMEYIDGADLLEHFNAHHKGGMIESAARNIFNQIVEAIRYMHGVGYIHCDLKLENILIDRNGNAKLTDFGFTVPYSNDKKMIYGKGSLNYASPEVVLKKSFYGPETDVWSLGVVLFCLVCGVMPINFDKIPAKLAYEHLEKDGLEIKKQGLSDGVKDLLLQMIEVNSTKRIGMEGIANHPWVKGQPLKSTKLDLNKIFSIPFVIRSPTKFVSPTSSPTSSPNQSPHRHVKDREDGSTKVSPKSTNTSPEISPKSPPSGGSSPTLRPRAQQLQRKTSLRQLKDDLLRTALKVGASKTPPQPLTSPPAQSSLVRSSSS